MLEWLYYQKRVGYLVKDKNPTGKEQELVAKLSPDV